MTALLMAAAASFAFDVPPWQGTTLGAEDTVPSRESRFLWYNSRQ